MLNPYVAACGPGLIGSETGDARESETKFIEVRWADEPGVPERSEVGRFLIIHAVARNCRDSLAGLKGKENRRARVAVARRQHSVREVAIDFDHVLVGAVGQRFGEETKLPPGCVVFGSGNSLKELRADGIDRDLHVLAGGWIEK